MWGCRFELLARLPPAPQLELLRTQQPFDRLLLALLMDRHADKMHASELEPSQLDTEGCDRSPFTPIPILLNTARMRFPEQRELLNRLETRMAELLSKLHPSAAAMSSNRKASS